MGIEATNTNPTTLEFTEETQEMGQNMDEYGYRSTFKALGIAACVGHCYEESIQCGGNIYTLISSYTHEKMAILNIFW